MWEERNDSGNKKEIRYRIYGRNGAFDCYYFDYGVYADRVYPNIGAGNYLDCSSGGSWRNYSGTYGRRCPGRGIWHHQFHTVFRHEPVWGSAPWHQSGIYVYCLCIFKDIDGMVDGAVVSGVSQV